MITDIGGSRTTFERRCDVAIVGGGPVALFVGVQLAKLDLKVCILESGGERFESLSQSFNQAFVTGRPHDGTINGRGRLLGGTSTLWGGQLSTFSEMDLAARPGISEAAWPISYSELAVYYSRVASALGLPCAQASDDAIKSKLKVNAGEWGACEYFYTRWMKQPNFAKLYAEEIQRSDRLSILLHATVTDIELPSGGKGLASLLARNTIGGSVRVSAPYIVLANGTIEIARLLLAVARRRTSVPWASNYWLGRCFQDHIDLKAAKVEIEDRSRFADLFDNVLLNGFKLQPKLRINPVYALEKHMHNVGCSFVYESSFGEDVNYLKVMLRSLRSGSGPADLKNLPRHLWGGAKVWFPMISRYLKTKRIMSLMDGGVSITVHCEQAPTPDSRISLSDNEVDAFGIPSATVHWSYSGRPEISSIRQFCEHVHHSLSDLGIANLHIDPRIKAEDVSVFEEARDGYHQCGGVRMARTADDGVVDENLKIFGTEAIFVAGAAAFPTSGFANPTFTALALGLRLVDHIKARLS